MNNLLTVAFEAHNAEHNHHRHYAVTVGRDLLDDWTVSITFGRSGQRGREIRYADADPQAMQAVIRERLHRRLSAPRRIGCPYRLAAFSAASGFDADAWLPGEMMDGFLGKAEVQGSDMPANRSVRQMRPVYSSDEAGLFVR